MAVQMHVAVNLFNLELVYGCFEFFLKVALRMLWIVPERACSCVLPLVSYVSMSARAPRTKFMNTSTN